MAGCGDAVNRKRPATGVLALVSITVTAVRLYGRDRGRPRALHAAGAEAGDRARSPLLARLPPRKSAVAPQRSHAHRDLRSFRSAMMEAILEAPLIATRRRVSMRNRTPPRAYSQ